MHSKSSILRREQLAELAAFNLEASVHVDLDTVVDARLRGLQCA
jgi:hypothetical protein